MSDEEDNLAVGPVHQMISSIVKIQKGITRPATPKTPDIRQSPITPDIKQSPPSSKKAKFFFKTGSKGKRLLCKTPLTKSSVKKSTPPFKTLEKTSEELATECPFSGAYGVEPWDTPPDRAEPGRKRITRQSRKDLRPKVADAVLKGTEKGILKKLEPAPGWKPFETPAKWKVDGQDW